jgi:hypothetical protein
MKRVAFLLVLVLGAAACSGTSTDPTTTTEPATTPPAADGSTTTTEVATDTSSTLVTGTATFAIGAVGFGETGWIEIVNLGPDVGDPGGHWIGTHPDYLELPHTIVEPGDGIAVTFGDARPRGIATRFPVNENLLPLSAGSGEVVLYDAGTFGDPSAVVDYLQWGEPLHFRSAVAIAAGVWPEDGVIVVPGNTAVIAASRLPATGPDDWAAQ